MAKTFRGLLLGLLLCVSAIAQTPGEKTQAATLGPDPIKAGVYVSPPFVTRGDGGYTGMAVELWNALAAERGLKTEFIEFTTFGSLIAAVRAGDVDVAVTNLTITEARAKDIDFTHPWFDAGLQIMISDVPRTGFSRVLGGLADLGHLRIYAGIGVIVLIATLLLTLLDRRYYPDFPNRWREGLAESFFAVMSVATTGQPPLRARLFGWIGRIWSALWLVCGVLVLAYVTSSVTSVMTTLALTAHVNGPSDLPGKTVGVLLGSTGDEYATKLGLRTVRYPNIDDAVAALGAGEIDAVVADAPVLNHFAHTRPQHDVSVVGEIFKPEKYGFGLAPNSPLRRALTVGLLGAEEAGVIESLRVKYFGARP